MTEAILVPLDGSQLGEGALPFATALARVEAADLDLLAVVEPMGPTPEAKRLESLLAEGMTSRLRGIADELRDSGLTADVHVRHGNPSEVILVEAEQRPARLVVMTTRGQGGLTRWLVGSVAEKVMQLARCPVLLVKPDPEPLSRSQSWQPKRLLVPLDGSALADQVLPVAYRWAAALGAEVVLANVQPWMVTRMIAGYDVYVPDFSALDEQAAEAAAEHLSAVQAQAPAGLTITSNVMRGDPAGTLIDLIEQQHIDLVVMTSNGRGGIGRLVLGSVADRLVRSGAAPVMIVRPVDSAPASEQPVAAATPRPEAP